MKRLTFKMWLRLIVRLVITKLSLKLLAQPKERLVIQINKKVTIQLQEETNEHASQKLLSRLIITSKLATLSSLTVQGSGKAKRRVEKNDNLWYNNIDYASIIEKQLSLSLSFSLSLKKDVKERSKMMNQLGVFHVSLTNHMLTQICATWLIWHLLKGCSQVMSASMWRTIVRCWIKRLT